MRSKPNIGWVIVGAVLTAIVVVGVFCWQAPWFCDAILSAFSGG